MRKGKVGCFKDRQTADDLQKREIERKMAADPGTLQ